MEKEQKLTVSVSPHVKDKADVESVMWSVVVALLPAAIGGVYFFGWKVLFIILLSIFSAVVTEYLIQKWRKVPVTVLDGSAVITGLLLALILPATVPLWIPILGSIFAVAIGKHVFGGLGHNIFNPALVGRAFLVVSWSAIMTNWVTPDGITAATPLGMLKQQGVAALMKTFSTTSNMYNQLFLGNIGGCIGETSVLLLLIGVIYLFWKKIISWRIPFTYIATVLVFAWIAKQDPVFHLLTGGLIIGAFFMATDYVTTPITKKGRLIFGFGCGLLTIIFRLYSSYPEGVMFSILLMNAATPLIDRFTKPKPFGFVKKNGKDK